MGQPESLSVMVAFAAPSGSGKTTLIEKLIRELAARGLRVGAVKSDAHRVELDLLVVLEEGPGKDTHRMREGGAQVTALVSKDQIAVFRDVEGPAFELEDLVRLFFPAVDVIVAEGFRSRGLPTVVVCRKGVSRDEWTWPREVIAVATDHDEEISRAPQAPRLDLNRPEEVAEFLCERFRLG